MGIEQGGFEDSSEQVEGKNTEFLADISGASSWEALDSVLEKYDQDGETVLDSQWGKLTPKELLSISKKVRSTRSLDFAPPELRGACQRLLDEYTA